MYYLCEITGGEIHSTDEVAEAGYFSLDDLPDVRPVDIGLITELYRLTESQSFTLENVTTTNFAAEDSRLSG